MKFRELLPFLTSRAPPLEMKGRVYASCQKQHYLWKCGISMKYITNIPHSVLTGDVNAHFTLWHSYTDDYRGQIIADVISNSYHITLNTNTPTKVRNTTLQQTSSPDINTVYNTLYNWTSWTTQHTLSSDIRIPTHHPHNQHTTGL